MTKLIPFVLGRYLNLLALVSPKRAGKTGFKIFCYPARSAFRPHHKEFLSTAKTTSFTHNNVRINVYQWGSGKKKLLFLHGWQSHSFRWKNYIESFSHDEYTLYALDAPGHGLSAGNFLTVPLYSEVIEKFLLQFQNIDTIISHSVGAFSTLYTLYRLPLIPVNKLVLMASPGEASDFIAFYTLTLKLSSKSVTQIKTHFENVIEQPVEFFSASKFAQNIKIPGLIIHDEEDYEASYHHSVSIHKAWPKSKLVLTKGLGHNLKSPLTIKEVINFVEDPNPVLVSV